MARPAPFKPSDFESLPRLTAGELRKKFARKDDKAIRLSLADILFGEQVITGDDGAEVVVKPVNFKGLSLMEREYGDLISLPSEDEFRRSPKKLVRLLTILVNQDLDADKEKTDDEVGKIVDSENMNDVIRIVMAAVRPTPASPESETGEASPSGQD